MKIIFLCLSLCMLCLAMSAQTEIKGVWHTGQDNATVTFFNKNGHLYGKLLATDNPYAKAGMLILHDLKYSNGKWSGQIYAPRRDKLFKVIITPKEKTMNLTVIAGVFKKKLTWEKVE